MPWWSWLIIWTCLGLALIGVLVLSGVRLFQKAMALFSDLDMLAHKAELLDQAPPNTAEIREEIAVLRKFSAVYERRRLTREAVHERRAARHEMRLTRARALIRFDASTRGWFPPRSR